MHDASAMRDDARNGAAETVFLTRGASFSRRLPQVYRGSRRPRGLRGRRTGWWGFLAHALLGFSTRDALRRVAERALNGPAPGAGKALWASPSSTRATLRHARRIPASRSSWPVGPSPAAP